MEKNRKLNSDYLKEINSRKDIETYFGDWINDDNTQCLKNKFVKAQPFEHLIIDNFLNIDYANSISNKFPNNFENWHKYYNPIEVKYAYDNIENFNDETKNLFYFLSSDKITKKIMDITNITNLTCDEYLHGAGLHAHPRYGRLGMHLDYEKHPYSGKQRRLNIILYLNKQWDEKWNGYTELWDKNMNNCITKSHVKFNTALLFRTNEISWHGIPEKIMCPENIYRKTLAYYYISPLENDSDNAKAGNNGSGYRTKAYFVKRPQDVEDNRMTQLFNIRPQRRIEEGDMKTIWPEWTPETY